jgi:predicted DNA-binding protein
MATVSFRVPDEVKERMNAHDEVNWSAVLRGYIEEELHERDSRNTAHAVATSERLSSAIDPEDVTATNTAETIREFRDGRYGERRS